MWTTEYWGGNAGGATSTTTLDLKSTPSDEGGLIVGHTYALANFDVEVVGNSAPVTLKSKGPFASSVAFDLSGGTFAIGGDKISVKGYGIGSLEFTTAGGAYTFNVIRHVS